ncbi:ABC transporter substrate-binding protein, partial [Camelimonas abortus]
APRFTQIHLADGRAPAQAPRRIVSINMCADELALRLARPGALVSVTPLSRDYMGSNVAELARRVPANRGAAEEIAALEPDLVIAGRYTTRLVKALLRRLGFTVAEFDVPGSIREARDQIREAGALFHNHAAAEAIAARFDRLLAAPAPSGPRPTAIVLRPAGFTSSEGSLLDDMLTRAGMTNLAGGPLAGYEQLPLEFVLAAQPDILVIAGDPDQPPSMASEILSHPALRRLAERAGVVTLPSRLWTCPGPGVLDAMALLQEAVARWRGRAAVAAAAPALTAPAAAERTGGGP